jgi:glycosyltransferase involved in cell wall biosynthesis
MRKPWENLARELKLDGCVRFVGRVSWDEVPSYIAGFDLGYIGNSRMEIGKMYHSPLKLYEYMAMAVPVISSDCADARDMIQPGRNGYIFRSVDEDDLKHAFIQAIRDRPRWREMGLAARQRVLERASWVARVQTMISGIERILEERSAGQHAGH